MIGTRDSAVWPKIRDFLTSRVLRNGLFAALALWGGVQVGRNIATSSLGHRVFLLGEIALLVGLKWGPFGYLCLLVAFAPFDWPAFNISRIPIIGWVFTTASLRERAVLVGGGIYLGALLFKSLRERARWRAMPSVPLGVMVAYGALVASLFAWFAGEQEMQWYLRVVLYGAVVFLLVYSLARTPQRWRAIVTCMILSGCMFSGIVLFFPPSAVSYIPATTSVNRLGGVWTLPLGMRIAANDVYVSSYLALSSVLAWAQLLTRRSLWRRWLLLAAIGLMTWVQFTTVSRTGVYGSAIGVAAVSLIYFFSRPRVRSGEQRGGVLAPTGRRKVGVLALLGVVLIFSFFGFNRFLGTYEDPSYALGRILRPITGKDPNAQGRVVLFMLSLKMSVAHPYGTGIMALPSATGVNQHSLYTLMLAGLGWIGFAAFAWLFGWCTVQGIRRLKATDPSTHDVALMLVGGLVTVFAMGFGHPIVGPLWGITLFWALLGLAAALPRLTHNGFSGVL